MIIVQLSRSVTHTAKNISRAHSAFKMAEGGASEEHPREGLHWLNAPSFVDSIWQWMLLKPEPIVNHVLYLDVVMGRFAMKKSIRQSRWKSTRQVRFGPFAHLHPSIPGQDCSSISLFSTSMDAAVHVHVKACDTRGLECQKFTEILKLLDPPNSGSFLFFMV